MDKKQRIDLPHFFIRGLDWVTKKSSLIESKLVLFVSLFGFCVCVCKCMCAMCNTGAAYEG